MRFEVLVIPPIEKNCCISKWKRQSTQNVRGILEVGASIHSHLSGFWPFISDFRWTRRARSSLSVEEFLTKPWFLRQHTLWCWEGPSAFVGTRMNLRVTSTCWWELDGCRCIGSCCWVPLPLPQPSKSTTSTATVWTIATATSANTLTLSLSWSLSYIVRITCCRALLWLVVAAAAVVVVVLQRQTRIRSRTVFYLCGTSLSRERNARFVE